MTRETQNLNPQPQLAAARGQHWCKDSCLVGLPWERPAAAAHMPVLHEDWQQPTSPYSSPMIQQTPG